jgi:hypothetical protein
MNNNKSTVYGVGFIGTGTYSRKSHIIYYRLWARMLERCTTKYWIVYPSYNGCTVTKSWHNFQNFAKWCDEKYVDGQVLDKDLILSGNKIYSPSTCCFLPPAINTMITKSNSIRGLLPIGVSKWWNKYRSNIKIDNKKKCLGLYNTPEEAFLAYKKAKEERLILIANENKSAISIEAYNALITYKVNISD